MSDGPQRPEDAAAHAAGALRAIVDSLDEVADQTDDFNAEMRIETLSGLVEKQADMLSNTRIREADWK